MTEAQDRARATWSAGDFDAIAQRIWEVGDNLVERVGVNEGERVLDVAMRDRQRRDPSRRQGRCHHRPRHHPRAARGRARQRRRGRGRGRVGRGRRPGPAVRGRLVRRRALDLRLHVRPRPRKRRRREIARVLAPGGRLRRRRLAARGQHRQVLPDDRQVRAAAAGGLPAAAAVGRARPRHRDLRRRPASSLRFEDGAAHWHFDSYEETVEEYSTKFGPIVMLRRRSRRTAAGTTCSPTFASMYEEVAVPDDGGIAFDGEYLITFGEKR